jgi:hypothetical protein
MASKRANLAGHGMEILFGAEDQRSPDRAGRAASRETQPKTDSPRGQSVAAADAVIRGDWWAALEAEAKSAMPSTEREPDDVDLPGDMGDIRRFVTSWMGEERQAPSAPSATGAGASLPRAAPARASQASPATVGPNIDEALPPLATTPALEPEPEASPATLYAAPVVGTPTRQAAPATLSADALEPDGPRSAPLDLRDAEPAGEAQDSRVRDEDEILAYIGDDQRQRLWKHIVTLYDEVPKVLVNDELQDEALQLLQEAQDILMEKPRQFDVAQYKVGQVQSILTRRRQTVRWTNTYGWLTFFYEGIWVWVLAVGIFYAPRLVSSITATFGAAESLVSVEQLWNTAAWGGVGGVLGALYSLYWHAAKVKDFDKQYLMWYVVQPVIGLIIGAALHVIIGAGFLTLIGEAAVTQGTPLRLFPYALAVIAAFRQRFILELVDRVIQLVTGTGDLDRGGKTAKEGAS